MGISMDSSVMVTKIPRYPQDETSCVISSRMYNVMIVKKFVLL